MYKHLINFVLLTIAIFFAPSISLSAAETGGNSAIPEFFNFYKFIASSVGLGYNAHSFLSGLLALAVLAIIGHKYKNYVDKALQSNNIEPSGKFSINTLTENILIMFDDVCGELFSQKYQSYISLMVSLFLFILIVNLSGLVPFLPPASVDFSANLGIALAVFIIYNYAGIKHSGLTGYLKHFAGPKVNIPVLGFVIMVLIFAIEIVSHMFRPASLSLRLMGNVFGDHMLVAVFTGMVYWLIPSILMFFGVLVSIIQAFVFSLLSGIYVSMAVSDDH